MSIEIKQGLNGAIEFAMPFDVSRLTKFTVDFYQFGERILSKSNGGCTVEGNVVTVYLSQADTLKFAPQRVSLDFRGKYSDGGTVIIESIPCTVNRSNYREAIT